MPLLIKRYVLGPMQNNTYVLCSQETEEAVIIDPSFEIERVIKDLANSGKKVTAIWLTHAHFDHFAGVNKVFKSNNHQIHFGLHADDLLILQNGGESRQLGINIAPVPNPDILLKHKQVLQISGHSVEVRHTPGHSPGHVIFYSEENQTAICGDLIFQSGIGRTDLSGGSYPQLIQSIRDQVFNLPKETRILSGHGPETDVQTEMAINPFLDSLR